MTILLTHIQLNIDAKLDYCNRKRSENFVSSMSARGLAHDASVVEFSLIFCH